MRRRAFTLSELLVAMGLTVALLAGAGVVFHSAVQAQRASIALSEIMRKFRGITDQLDADFMGLRKDGEIWIAWIAGADFVNGGYHRFDRMMFFTDNNGNYDTYNAQPVIDHGYDYTKEYIKGNETRVCYMLARDGANLKPQAQDPAKRILSRTQHIRMGSGSLDPFPPPDEASETILDDEVKYLKPDLATVPDLSSIPLAGAGLTWAQEFRDHNLLNEYDSGYEKIQEWIDAPTRLKTGNTAINPVKERLFSIIMNLEITASDGTNMLGIPGGDGGTMVDPEDPSTFHMMLGEGVGQFTIQGWYDADGSGPGPGRWFPEVDPDGDGVLTDSDFYTAGSPLAVVENQALGLLYPDCLLASATESDPGSFLNEDNFDFIPGLGRALKFTFTLYDSRGIYKNGKTFTHIVWLDN